MPTQATITATIADPSGTALTNGAFVRFRLRNFQGFVPRVSGTSIVCETQIDAQPNGSGNISQALWKNSDITPSSTYYTVEFWSLGRITSSGNYIFNADTNLNTASQLNTPPVPPGFSLVLENNGVLNSSQSVLNIESTDSSITITDRGSGNIDLASGAGNVSLPFFVGPGRTDVNDCANASASMATVGTNVVNVLKFLLNGKITVGHVSVFINQGFFTGTMNIGIYSTSGNKLLDASFDNTVEGAIQTVAITPVTLTQGEYYLAWSSSSTASVVGFTGINQSGGYSLFSGTGTVKWGTAANAYVSPNLPATLGAITPFTASPGMGGVPAALFET